MKKDLGKKTLADLQTAADGRILQAQVQMDAAKNPANHIHSAWRRLPIDFGLAE